MERRKIGNIWCRCFDTGCSDFVRAAQNRKMVRLKQNIIGYVQIEELVKSWPRRKPLPYWIPQGNLVIVGKNELKNLFKHGIFETEEIERGR